MTDVELKAKLDAEQAELDRKLSELSPKVIEAAEAYVRERTPGAFYAWRAVNRDYVALHKRWWALACPAVRYESVFGATE